MNSIEPNESINSCIICDYICHDKSNYKKHLETKKHKTRLFELSMNTQENTNNLIEPSDDVYKCKQCNKIYKNRNGLWYHKKKCQTSENIIDVLINEHKDFKNIILDLVKNTNELQKQMLEICKTQQLST
jgi:hypothetical protein